MQRSDTPAPKSRVISSSVLERFTPLIECSTEADGWIHVAQLGRELFDADMSLCVEYTRDEALILRSGSGHAELETGTLLPIAPGSHAEYLLDHSEVVITTELEIEDRYQPSEKLLKAGIRSTMTARVAVPDGGIAVIGVHSREPNFFDQDDANTLSALTELFGSAIRRLRRWESIEHTAQIDALTGLMTRSSILDHLDDRFWNGSGTSALILDLDGFKSVNVNHGHAIGDDVLRTVSIRLERALSPWDHIGRLGGDEFLVVSEAALEADDDVLAQRLISATEEVFNVDSQTIQLSASIGIARQNAGDQEPIQLVERADRLLTRAKAAGRGAIKSDPSRVKPDRQDGVTKPSISRVVTKTMLDEAIEGVRVVVQPIIDPSDGSTHGIEALARGPEGHVLEMPDRLFPAARANARLGDLELAAKQRAFELELDPAMMLYVNVEPTLLTDESWMRRLVDVWKGAGGHPSVTIELTERSMLRAPGSLLRAVDACRHNGWRIALDDVGSRSESLAALRLVDPDVVKLDMSLVSTEHAAHAAHVSAAVAMQRKTSRGLDRLVIVEGIESAEDIQTANILGADFLQGYQFGFPRPFDELDHTASQLSVEQALMPRHSELERVATLSELVNLSRHIESLDVSPDSILIATVQHHSSVTDRTRRRYMSLAKRCGFAGLIGVGVNSDNIAECPGVRLAEIPPDDPLVETWQVLSLSPSASIALCATEIETHSDATSGKRLFRYHIDTDPETVERKARELIRHF